MGFLIYGVKLEKKIEPMEGVFVDAERLGG
jgi:hypothetical protein